MMILTEELITKRLDSHYDPQATPNSPYPQGYLSGEPQRASVLIPFLQKGADWHILFIHRTSNQNDLHSGQVAFPGGRFDHKDRDAINTALREAHEEIGIEPDQVKVLGKLNDFMTITNYQVTPIIGVIPWPIPLKLQIEEVKRVFTIPLDWLANENHFGIKERKIKNFFPLPVIYYEMYENEILWGASARIMLYLLFVLDLLPHAYL
ncbi:MAG TPA: CoA pyrophosphatase [Anaerolineae bacterium]|nr:CoA pyrophosphatase [Anaerolineae bacterium]